MIANNLKELMKALDGNKGCAVYIWGAGLYGELLGRYFNENGVSWDGYFDNYVYKSRSELNGKKIQGSEAMMPNEKSIFVLSMRNDPESVVRQLISLGISEQRMIFSNNGGLAVDLDKLDIFDDEKAEKIRAFKDIHKGKRCFIIGNGPSLRLEDLERIGDAGDISFASNMIFNCYDNTRWRPWYHFIMDTGVIKKIEQDAGVMKQIADGCRAFFIRKTVDTAAWSAVLGEKLKIFNHILPPSRDVVYFSNDCAKQVYGGDTVTYTMLQMAAYMGIEKLYLIGVDHTFAKEFNANGEVVVHDDVKNHADILKNYDVASTPPQKIYLAASFVAAKKYAKENGIEICNATRGGALEVFRRVDFDSLF
jgi:hypothetical protein